MKPRCNICGSDSGFLHPEQLKEGFICRNCSATSRNRLVMFALGHLLGNGEQPVFDWPARPEVRILEPCPRGPQVAMLRDKFEYITPEFDAEEIARGAPPEKFADVQDLAFPDDHFDFVIASDVFEHVREDEKGFREIYRTLKPGGVFVMTSPYDHQREKTVERVQVEGDKDIYLAEPRYAGGGGVTLDYREYGRDLLTRLSGVGYTVGILLKEIPRFQIYPSAVIIAVKGDYLELAPFIAGDAGTSAYPALGPMLPNRLFVWYKFNLRSLGYYLRQARMRLFG